ncbi:MAG TPA: DUF3891 family protein [Gemmatimonadota bacterium]|nr:DUF3891 family protein [Gemmatimonadota bacterium]
MIVRPVPDGLLCIRQLDHAALSGELARAWGGAVPELAPRAPVELAAARHDAGWSELDEAPRLDPVSGGPHTYRTLPIEDALAIAERSVERVAAADPYAGWLVSRHFASFHAASEAPAARAWATAQVGRRAGLLSRAWPRVGREALHPHALEANFDWIQLLDALSLALCEGWESWESRATCVGYGEETGTFRYRRVEPADDPLVVGGGVEPWPFKVPEFQGAVPARRLPPGPWSRPEALDRAWREARPVTLEVVLAAG